MYWLLYEEFDLKLLIRWREFEIQKTTALLPRKFKSYKRLSFPSFLAYLIIWYINSKVFEGKEANFNEKESVNPKFIELLIFGTKPKRYIWCPKIFIKKKHTHAECLVTLSETDIQKWCHRTFINDFKWESFHYRYPFRRQCQPLYRQNPGKLHWKDCYSWDWNRYCTCKRICMKYHFWDANISLWNIHLLSIGSCSTAGSALSQEQPMCQVEAVLEEGIIVCRDLVSIRCPRSPKLED